MPTPATQAIPADMHALTPHLICAGAAAAIDFYKAAFGAVEKGRIPGPGGTLMHAAVRIGDSTLMLVDEAPDWGLRGPKTLKGSGSEEISMRRLSEDCSSISRPYSVV